MVRQENLLTSCSAGARLPLCVQVMSQKRQVSEVICIFIFHARSPLSDGLSTRSGMAGEEVWSGTHKQRPGGIVHCHAGVHGLMSGVVEQVVGWYSLGHSCSLLKEG